MANTKIIALYLPQFHEIKENDEFWGKGFTDWCTVKNAKPLFEGHQQPRIPLNNNYYDLSINENVRWQAKLAKEYGVYGFGVYHYWFNNDKNLLTKPAEIMRDDNSIETNYFFVWDNASWRRSWSNVEGNDWAPIQDLKQQSKIGPQTLIPFILGSEPDWENHYNYLQKHFQSPKYIKVNHKPVFAIYNTSNDVYRMCQFWNRLACRDGYDGIFFIFNSKGNDIPEQYYKYSYAPHSAGLENHSILSRIERKLNKMFWGENHIDYYSYDTLWKRILKKASCCSDPTSFYGAFVAYDDTPRRGKFRGKIVEDASPEKFQRYLTELVKISNAQNKEFLFVTAWNEWGEGAYLEPDIENGYKYLEALKKSIEQV